MWFRLKERQDFLLHAVSLVAHSSDADHSQDIRIPDEMLTYRWGWGDETLDEGDEVWMLDTIFSVVILEGHCDLLR